MTIDGDVEIKETKGLNGICFVILSPKKTTNKPIGWSHPRRLVPRFRKFKQCLCVRTYTRFIYIQLAPACEFIRTVNNLRKLVRNTRVCSCFTYILHIMYGILYTSYIKNNGNNLWKRESKQKRTCKCLSEWCKWRKTILWSVHQKMYIISQFISAKTRPKNKFMSSIGRQTKIFYHFRFLHLPLRWRLRVGVSKHVFTFIVRFWHKRQRV